MDYLELNVGGDVKAQLTADYKLEVAAVEMYNKAVVIARDNNDDASRELFALLLKDEEEHVEWLEAQLHQIKELGYETYLSNLTVGKEG
jgi:bacterioferritin